MSGLLLYDGTASGDFLLLRSVEHPVTGQRVRVQGEVHRDDVEWLLGLWRDYFDLEYRITTAGCAMPHDWTPWGSIYHGGYYRWRECQRCGHKDKESSA